MKSRSPGPDFARVRNLRMALDPDKQPVPAGTPEPDSTTATDAVTPDTHADSHPVDDSYGYHDDPYAYESNTVPAIQEQAAAPPVQPPPPPVESEKDEEEEDEGMLRMSFLEHLEELRGRIVRCLVGFAVAFLASLTFCNPLWRFVSAPATAALKELGIQPAKLVQISPMEGFSVVWVKMPLLCAVFLSAPWVLYQVWAFIAPGLYKRERRWAAPFVIVSASLFIIGGLFAYFVAFRFGLTFLLGIGRDIDIIPMVSVTTYFDLFVNVTLGVALIFELPVLIFFLTLLRIASPRFLITHSRYAILVIVLVAAIVTPTPDIFNLMLFAVPMVALYFVGIFASYLLVLHREEKKFPWWTVILVALGILLLIAAGVYIAIARYGFQFTTAWPFLVR